MDYALFVILSGNQNCLTDPHHPLDQTCGKDMSKKTIEEIEALLRLLTECEREELEQIMLERREAEMQKQLHELHKYGDPKTTIGER